MKVNFNASIIPPGDTVNQQRLADQVAKKGGKLRTGQFANDQFAGQPRKNFIASFDDKNPETNTAQLITAPKGSALLVEDGVRKELANGVFKDSFNQDSKNALVNGLNEFRNGVTEKADADTVKKGTFDTPENTGKFLKDSNISVEGNKA